MPNTKKGKVKTDERARRYLTPAEVEKLRLAAGGNRHAARDQAMILLAYRHGLRAGELVSLEWRDVELEASLLHVRRLKKGTPSCHPLRGPELRALRALFSKRRGPYVFVSERGGPMTTRNFRAMLSRISGEAELGFKAHPHMLRHACGFKLANEGHDTRSLQHYLGHRNIQHTVRYTELTAERFKDFWRD